ncbi:hypothetical protein EON62_06435, partial [archaeon]
MLFRGSRTAVARAVHRGYKTDGACVVDKPERTLDGAGLRNSGEEPIIRRPATAALGVPLPARTLALTGGGGGADLPVMPRCWDAAPAAVGALLRVMGAAHGECAAFIAAGVEVTGALGELLDAG